MGHVNTLTKKIMFCASNPPSNYSKYKTTLLDTNLPLLFKRKYMLGLPFLKIIAVALRRVYLALFQKKTFQVSVRV